MQELSVQPTNPTPYTPAGGTYNFNPTPGAGGLPSLSGLSRNMNPMAEQLQAQGRGDDSVLVHMTPGEVNSLRGLAQQFGGDLTMNPNTGLPEAGWLGKLLPTILGVAGAAMGIPTWAIGAGVGVGGTALTGDLNKGLMAGLQAFGGASLAGAAGIGGGAGAASGVAPEAAANLAPGAATSAATSGLTIPADIAAMGAPVAAPTLASTTLQAAAPTLGQTIASQAPKTLLAPGVGAPATPGLLSKFGAAAREGMKAGTIPYKIAPMAAGLGSLSALSEATAPDLRKYEPEEDKWKYEGPYMPVQRRLRPRVEGEGEISFFEDANPYPGFLTRTGGMPTGYAGGGLTLSGVPVKDEPAPSNTTDITKMTQRELTSTGYTDPTTGVRSQLPRDPFAYGIPPGSRTDLGGNSFVVTEKGDWEYAGPVPTGYTSTNPAPGTPTPPPGPLVQPPPPPDRTPPPVTPPPVTPPGTPPGTGVNTAGTYTYGDISPTMGGVTPGTGRGATVSEPTLSPGATASGYGAEVLKDKYTPQFTQKADFMTAPVTPYTDGTDAMARLESLTKGFQTSPGAITASRTYTGGSPSQRIREAAKANATRGEIDYGLRTPTTTTGAGAGAGAGAGTGTGANPYLDPNFTGNFFDQFWSSYYNPGGTGTGGANGNVNAANYVNPYAAMYTNPGANPYVNPYASEVFTGEPNYGGGRGREVNDSIQMNAKGGSIHMDDGAFVVDARTVSELGNGSSSAGQELLARLGGRPVKGPGDGVSDSIPANIGGVQEARVARDEVIIPAAAVRKLGGAKKLYALMEKAHKARKKAKRGEDTKVAKGLGALS